MTENVHQLVEAVVSETVGGLQKRVEELELNRAGMENSLAELEAVVAELKESFVSLHEETSRRLTEYNSKLDAITGQIAGLKNAVEKLLK